jgi:hypothetical protein
MNGRLLCLLMPLLVGSELVAQAAKARAPLPVPKISGRSFVGGSAKVTVTGSFQIDADVAINAKASFGDGEMTWIQFGVSGAAEPNALITYGDQGIGIIVGLGKNTATAEPSAEDAACTGEVNVTASSVAGQYTCREVASYNPTTGKMGKVNITVRFTAKS